MKRIMLYLLFIGIISVGIAFGQNKNGNPRPGVPHDTIVIHVQKANSGPRCMNIAKLREAESSPSCRSRPEAVWVGCSGSNGG